MKESLLASLGFKLMLLMTAGLAVGTMGVVASKVSSAINETKIPSKGLEIAVEPSEIPKLATPTMSNLSLIDLKEIEEQVTAKTTGKCIITLFGKKYDMTELNLAASGGDIFRCGGDMTNIYRAKYGTNVDKMQRFLVSELPTITPVAAEITVTPTGRTDSKKSFGFEDDDNEREDEENRERYEDSSSGVKIETESKQEIENR